MGDRNRKLQGSLWSSSLCQIQPRWGTIRLRIRGRYTATLADCGGEDLWPVEVRGLCCKRDRLTQCQARSRCKLDVERDSNRVSTGGSPSSTASGSKSLLNQCKKYFFKDLLPIKTPKNTQKKKKKKKKK